MNITMTPREALAIQAAHIEVYSRIRADLREVLATLTDVAGLDLDAPLSVIEINRRIPRGVDIETLCGIDGGGA